MPLFMNDDYRDNYYNQAPGPYDHRDYDSSFDYGYNVYRQPWVYDPTFDQSYRGPNNYGGPGPMRNGMAPHPPSRPYPQQWPNQEWERHGRPEPTYPFSEGAARMREEYDNQQQNHNWRQQRGLSNPGHFDNEYRYDTPNGPPFRKPLNSNGQRWDNGQQTNENSPSKGQWVRPPSGCGWVKPPVERSDQFADSTEMPNGHKKRRRDKRQKWLQRTPEKESFPPRRRSSYAGRLASYSSVPEQVPKAQGTSPAHGAKRTPQKKKNKPAFSKAQTVVPQSFAVKETPPSGRIQNAEPPRQLAEVAPKNEPANSSAAFVNVTLSEQIPTSSNSASPKVESAQPKQPSVVAHVAETPKTISKAQTVTPTRSTMSPFHTPSRSAFRARLNKIHQKLAPKSKGLMDQMIESPKKKKSPGPPENAKENISAAPQPVHDDSVPAPVEKQPLEKPKNQNVVEEKAKRKLLMSDTQKPSCGSYSSPPKKRKVEETSNTHPSVPDELQNKALKEVQEPMEASPVPVVPSSSTTTDSVDPRDKVENAEIQPIEKMLLELFDLSASLSFNKLQDELANDVRPQMVEEPSSTLTEDMPQPAEEEPLNLASHPASPLTEISSSESSLSDEAQEPVSTELSVTPTSSVAVNESDHDINLQPVVESATPTATSTTPLPEEQEANPVSPDLPEASRSADEPQTSPPSSDHEDGTSTVQPTLSGLKTDIKVEVEDPEWAQNQAQYEAPTENQATEAKISVNSSSQIVAKQEIEDSGYEKAAEAPEVAQHQEKAHEEEQQLEGNQGEASAASTDETPMDKEVENGDQGEEAVQNDDGNKENEEPTDKQPEAQKEDKQFKRGVIPSPVAEIGCLYTIVKDLYRDGKMNIKEVVKIKKSLKIRHPEMVWDFSFLKPETVANFEAGTKFLDGCVDLFEKQQLTKRQAEKLIESYKNMFPGVSHALEVVKDEDPELVQKRVRSKKAFMEALEKSARPMLLPNFDRVVHDRNFSPDMWEHACVRCLCHNAVEFYGSKRCSQRHALCESIHCSECHYEQEDYQELFKKWNDIHCFHPTEKRGEIAEEEGAETPSEPRGKNRLCGLCRQPGHIKTSCPENKNKKKKKK